MTNSNKNYSFNLSAFKGSVLDKIFVRSTSTDILNAPSRIGASLHYPDGRIVKDPK